MRLFPVADVLTITTGRLCSEMGRVYEILNFMTGDSLFTHQLPRAMEECGPWIAAQYPELMSSAPKMREWINELDAALAIAGKDKRKLQEVVKNWAEGVRLLCKMPPEIPVYELGAEMHTRIDPIEEAAAIFGDKRVISVKAGGQ